MVEKRENLVSWIENAFLVLYVISINISTSNTQENSTEKINILLWTSPQVMPFLYYKIGPNLFKERYCEFQNCHLTDNKTYFEDVSKFDVVLFNAKDVNVKDLPKNRTTDQKYVLLMSDYPPQSIVTPESLRIFNLTWGYKLSSDIIWPKIIIRDIHGKIVGPKLNMNWIKPGPVQNFVLNKLKNKNKAVLYSVSSCNYINHSYMKNLNQALFDSGYRVDKYTKCNRTANDNCYLVVEKGYQNNDCESLPCPNRAIGMSCESMIESDYYFYLAFENDHDEDLISRHLLTPLQHFAVPVVFGGADYTRFLPEGSYINADGLSPEVLAKKMLQLIVNSENYYNMFSWHKYYQFHVPEMNPDSDPFCRFCALLNDKEKMKESVRRNYIVNWFNTYEKGKSFYKFNDSKVQIVDLTNFRFLRNSKICNTKRPLPVITIVISAIQNFDRREVIRQTWGKNTNFMKTVFILGDTPDLWLTRKIEEEHKQFGDIVQGNFMDTYRNLTYKHIMSLYWMTNHCPIAKHIMKTDDDVFVSVNILKKFLKNDMEEKDLIACYILYDNPVIRDMDSKWFLDWSEFKKDTFPWFCSGPFVIYNPKVAPLMVDAATNVPFLYLEDVYTTGLLRERLKLPLKDINYLRLSIYHYDVMQQAWDRIKTFLFGINYSVTEMQMLWDMVEGYYSKVYKAQTLIPTVPDEYSEIYQSATLSPLNGSGNHSIAKANETLQLKALIPLAVNKTGLFNLTLRANSNVCKSSGYISVIGVVMSSLSHLKLRQTIRQTWGNNTKYLKIVFIVGETDNEKLANETKRERYLYGDIVQGNFVDSYQNLTRKHIMALYWVMNFCSKAQYVLKTDDDVFVNINVLKELLHALEVHDVMTCCVATETTIIKDDKNKYNVVKKGYKKDGAGYQYCDGSLIIYSTEVIPKLLAAAVSEPFFIFDNIYVTGILRQKLNLPLHDITYLRLKANDSDPLMTAFKKKGNFLFGNDYTYSNIELLWKYSALMAEQKKNETKGVMNLTEHVDYYTSIPTIPDDVTEYSRSSDVNALLFSRNATNFILL